MQYILTEQEYKTMQTQSDSAVIAVERKLQAVCTMLATTMPVHFWGRPDPEPWGCVRLEPGTEEYNEVCDECPAEPSCPYDHKEYSQ